MKRISQLEALALFTVNQGDPVDAKTAAKLVKRGLACYTAEGGVCVSTEGREAFRQWAGTDL